MTHSFNCLFDIIRKYSLTISLVNVTKWFNKYNIMMSYRLYAEKYIICHHILKYICSQYNITSVGVFWNISGILKGTIWYIIN